MIDRGCPNKNDSIVAAMLFLFYQLVYHNVLCGKHGKSYIYVFSRQKQINSRFDTSKNSFGVVFSGNPTLSAVEYQIKYSV